MPTVIALGLGAAIYPQLLAVVILILTREQAHRLLWACYLGCLVTSCATGAALLVAFRSQDTVAGTSAARVGPAGYLVAGAVALIVAAIVATPARRERFGRARRRMSMGQRAPRDSPGWSSRAWSHAERALQRGSVAVAGAVGVALGVPGPFDLLAYGHLARSGYGLAAALPALIVFNLIKFVLIEAPLVSYALRPQQTAVDVERFASWMQAHKLHVVAAVVALIGALLILRGVAAL